MGGREKEEGRGRQGRNSATREPQTKHHGRREEKSSEFRFVNLRYITRKKQ